MTVGPDYERPDTTLPDSWTREIAADVTSTNTGAQLYWRKFGDPVLNTLIAHARKNNPNVYIASKRINESWHQRGVLSAAFYPKVEIAARDEYGIATYDRDYFKVDPGASHYQIAQLQYGWELDVFGKIKRQTEAAEGEYEASIEGWRDTLVFITAEVAISYIAYRTLERRIEIAELGTKNFQELRDKIAERFNLGIASKLELEESTARLKTSAAQIPRLNQERELVRNRLALLCAVEPGKIPTILAQSKSIPTPPESIAVSVPANILRSRPDIRRAERKMAAQTARIGIAEAFLYPEFSISGALTYEYLRRGVTTEILDRVLGIGSNLAWRIFNGCADKHRIKENEALLDQMVGVYNQVIIQAITEVENNMSRLHYTKKRLTLLQEARAAHKNTSDLMNEAYLTGEVDLRRLLNAQVDYIATLDEEAATEGRRAAHSVRLFKALGGGELVGVPEEKHYKSLAKKGFWTF